MENGVMAEICADVETAELEVQLQIETSEGMVAVLPTGRRSERQEWSSEGGGAAVPRCGAGGVAAPGCEAGGPAAKI